MRKSNYEKCPVVSVDSEIQSCIEGWKNVCAAIQGQVEKLQLEKKVIVIECYHGILDDEVEGTFRTNLVHQTWINSKECFKGEQEITRLIEKDVTEDRVFGIKTRLSLEDMLDSSAIMQAQERIQCSNNVVVIYGPGAASIAEQCDQLVYVDLTRWEIQKRLRKKQITNLGFRDATSDFVRAYKQCFFVDWVLCDNVKRKVLPICDYYLDTNVQDNPKMICGLDLLKAMKLVTQRPFRLVPFFDPGPWGGQWMKEVCDLDRDVTNYAWCFDCVPEENSLRLGFGSAVVEIPSINLVLFESIGLLGEKVYARFGAEFPIRFDFLDTVGGGNLSLQVHPTTEYIQAKFGMHYTQDESYYILDAKDDAVVYLGVKDDVSPTEMLRDLHHSQIAGKSFDAEKHVAKWPVKKHNHLSIPSGTIHCSGRNCMVLEISATPYIFTFKLWDWGRLGLDGVPRPIHLDHGKNVINWKRTASWVKMNALDLCQVIDRGDGWVEERTGLNELEFIETRRHWFSTTVWHRTGGNLQVLNLVEGEEVIVESPEGKFSPYVVHYAETFIIPAAVDFYTITPYGESVGKKCATIKAFVRF